MANIKGRNVRVEIAATFADDLAVTAVNTANPGVATAAAHGLSNDAVGYFHTVGGMEQLELQAVRLKNKTDNTFELQGLNTSNYSAYTSGFFKRVATWALMSESTSYEIGGGAGEKLDATRLMDIVRKTEQGLLPEQTISVGVLAQDSPGAALQLIESAVQTQGFVLLRITLANGAVRIGVAEPSTPGENVQVGALGTGSLDFAAKGFVLKLAA